jgi:hypothetical protein
MPASLEPKTEILPKAQREIWPLLAPAPKFSFVLYGGTAVALYLGHRISIDFDFFSMAGIPAWSCEQSAFSGTATWARFRRAIAMFFWPPETAFPKFLMC